MSHLARLLSTAEVAAELGLTVRQVARLAPETLQPAAKAPGLRGAFLFAETDVLDEKRRRGLIAAKASPHPSGVDAGAPAVPSGYGAPALSDQAVA